MNPIPGHISTCRVRLFRCPVCPDMELVALSGSMCSTNGELVVDAPTTVEFTCSYDNPLGPTVYQWYLDGALQAAFTTSSASIPLSVGSHEVKCAAVISDSSSADCSCEASETLTVAAIGKRRLVRGARTELHFADWSSRTL